MSTTISNAAASQAARGRVLEAEAARAAQPVVYWAVLGMMIMAFWAWIMFRWVTGPYFTPTLPGPTPQPEWQGPAQVAFQAIMGVAIVVAGYKLLLKPWLREKRMTTDGAMFIAFFTMFFQDQITMMGGGYWFTYNAHVFNMGSWFPEIPGWATFAQPGQTPGEPILMMGPGYAYFFLAMTFLGMAIMRRFRERWPTLSTPVLFFAVFVACALLDMVIEVGFWIPLGFYSYTYGGVLPMIHKGTIQQFPMIEALGTGWLSTSIVALRYYTDDKGQTLVERGLDKVVASPGRKAVLRMFAMIAAIQLIFFFIYNVPMYPLGEFSKDWPKAIQERSYLMNNICGTGTDRMCATSDTPIAVNSAKAISVTPDGRLKIPADAEAQQPVPFLIQLPK